MRKGNFVIGNLNSFLAFVSLESIVQKADNNIFTGVITWTFNLLFLVFEILMCMVPILIQALNILFNIEAMNRKQLLY